LAAHREADHILGRDLFSSRLRLPLSGHVAQCRRHHGTFPPYQSEHLAETTRLLHSPGMDAQPQLRHSV
jgi:hypothetical protein